MSNWTIPKNFIVASVFLFIPFFSLAEPYQIVTEAFPPYIYEEDGVLVGMDIEVLNEAARLAEIEVKVSLFPWKRAYQMAVNGQADGILTIGYKKERDDIFFYPEQPTSFGIGRAFANDSVKDDLENIYDLKHLTVGVLRGHMYGEEFDSCKQCTIDLSTGYDMLVKKLAANRFPVALGNEAVILYTLKKNKITGIRATSYKFINAKYYIASSKASLVGKELNEKLSDALMEMKRNGTLESIWHKYKIKAEE